MKDNLKNEYNAAFDLIDRNLKNYAEKIAFVDDNTSITYKELFINNHKERVIADFIAGMTDRYAINLYNSTK